MIKYSCFFILLLLVTYNCNQASVDMEKEKEKVLQAWQEGNQALEDSDWETYSNYWAHTDYIQIIHPNEREWLQGWETIGPEYKKLIAGDTDFQANASDIQIQISADAQMGWLTCKTNIRMSAEDTMEFESWQTNIFEKIDGEWKLVHGHASNMY